MIELLDIYDGNKRLVGIAGRSVAHAFGLWHKTAHCWIVWDGRIVFSQRGGKIKDNPGKLYVTASGHISAGESAESAVLRELAEEVGLGAGNLAPRKIAEKIHTADVVKSDGTVMFDRALVQIFSASIDDIRQIRFADGEVDRVVAIDIAGFISWAKNSDITGGAIAGIEWNGSRLSDVSVSPGDFLLAGGITVYSEYGKAAELIRDCWK
ncbi:MAG: NUDIX domain-containing protein [Rickettsiales bacterium]|nr:NUDIX domain-containing protein [Rickettsiales bacterium]